MKKLLALATVVLFLAGCEGSYNETTSGAVLGGAGGAGLGAIIGSQSDE